MERDFLNDEIPCIMPAGYKSDLDVSIPFPCHIIVEGCCRPDTMRPQGVTAVSIVNILLRRKEEKTNIEKMQHQSEEGLEG